MSALVTSYIELLDRIEKSGTVCVKTENGYAHSYDKDEVAEVRSRIKGEILRLQP